MLNAASPLGMVRVLVRLVDGATEIHTFSTLLAAAVFLGGVADRQPELVHVTVCDGRRPEHAIVAPDGAWTEAAPPLNAPPICG